MSVILDSLAFAYVAVPKVACTSIKTMMFEVENGFPFPSFTASGRAWWIHDFYRSIPFSELPKDRIASYRRVAVLRDPVQRLLSCYGNRVVHNRELSREKARRPLRDAGLPFDPDLSTFVAHLEGYMQAVASIHHHARPMVDYLGDDAGYYTRLYRMRELGALVDDIQTLTGRRFELQRLQRGGPSIPEDALSAAETARLRTFYAADYDAYGALI